MLFGAIQLPLQLPRAISHCGFIWLNRPVLLFARQVPTRAANRSQISFIRFSAHFFSICIFQKNKVNLKARIGKVEDDTNAFRTAIDAFGQDDEVGEVYIRVGFF